MEKHSWVEVVGGGDEEGEEPGGCGLRTMLAR
jgi:hypothetical protein